MDQAGVEAAWLDVVVGAERFPIRFTGANKAMAVLGLMRRNSYADVTATELIVRMGWAFRATVPRTAIRSVAPDSRRVCGWGVHGWRGEWLVNGSSSGILRIEIEPTARALVTGVPVKLRVLRVSVDDPDGFRLALAI